MHAIEPFLVLSFWIRYVLMIDCSNEVKGNRALGSSSSLVGCTSNLLVDGVDVFLDSVLELKKINFVTKKCIFQNV